VDHVFSLIGQFDLDPNRVLDIALDVFEQRPSHHLSFVTLLRRFKVANIVHILGFKLAQYHHARDSESEKPLSKGSSDSKSNIPSSGKKGVEANTKAKVNTVTPNSLYALAAMLVMQDLVNIDELLPYLQPTAAETLIDSSRLEGQLRVEVENCNKLSLSSIAAASGASQDSQTLKNNSSAVPLSNEISSKEDRDKERKPPPPPVQPKSSSTVVSKPPPPAYPPPAISLSRISSSSLSERKV
jgi:THO complex subunit 2